MFKHKQYGISIKIKKNKFAKDVMSMLEDGKICMGHILNYNLFDKTYRLYRRGKNRCKNCGVKL